MLSPNIYVRKLHWPFKSMETYEAPNLHINKNTSAKNITESKNNYITISKLANEVNNSWECKSHSNTPAKDTLTWQIRGDPQKAKCGRPSQDFCTASNIHIKPLCIYLELKRLVKYTVIMYHRILYRYTLHPTRCEKLFNVELQMTCPNHTTNGWVNGSNSTPPQ